MNPTPDWLEKLVKFPDIDMNLKAFGGHRQKVNEGWKAELETHFAFEIMYIINGTQLTKFDGREIQFEEKSILLIPPGTPHENSCYGKKELDYFCMHFDIDDPEIQSQLLMYCPILLDSDNAVYEQITNILHNYIKLLTGKKFGVKEKIEIEILLLELMSALMDYVEDEKNKLAHSDNTTLILAKEIAEIVKHNFHLYTKEVNWKDKNLLSMDKTAESLNISNSTMLKVFKKVYKISPKQYLDQLRFNQAKFLLHQPKLTIAEIADVIGYQNAAHFTRQFKKWSTLSPNTYRKIKRIK